MHQPVDIHGIEEIINPWFNYPGLHIDKLHIFLHDVGLYTKTDHWTILTYNTYNHDYSVAFIHSIIYDKSKQIPRSERLRKDLKEKRCEVKKYIGHIKYYQEKLIHSEKISNNIIKNIKKCRLEEFKQNQNITCW